MTFDLVQNEQLKKTIIDRIAMKNENMFCLKNMDASFLLTQDSTLIFSLPNFEGNF